MHVYIAVTKDKYELPVAVADTAPELARMLGVETNTIYSCISHMKAGQQKSSKYYKIDIGDI